MNESGLGWLCSLCRKSKQSVKVPLPHTLCQALDSLVECFILNNDFRKPMFFDGALSYSFLTSISINAFQLAEHHSVHMAL